MSAPLIELAGVSRRYPNGDSEVRALDGITLTLQQGEFVALLGPSGCGKSTLMNVLGCLDRPSDGVYRVNGQDVSTLDADTLASLRRDTFGFVFQRYNLITTATAADNVALPAIYAGLTLADRQQRARILLGKLGLAERADHRPSQLSGGQQQRVSIARALINDAPVVLADEPTGALDTRSGQDVLALLKQLHSEGRTIILITHDLDIARHAERIVRLRDGQVESDSGPAPRSSAPPPPRPPSGQPSLRAELGESLSMAFTALRANVFRTVLTLLGVIIGVAAVVAMMAIGDGGKQEVLARISAMGTNLLLVRPGAPGVRPSGELASLTLADTEALQTLPGVEAVSPERGSSVTLRVGNLDYRTQVKGVWPSYPSVRDWPMAEGLFFSQTDLNSYAPVIVLGSTVASTLFPDGRSPLGRYVLVKNVPFEVVGVLGAKGATPFGSDQDDVVLVPLTTGFMRIFGKQYASSVTVRVKDVEQIDAVESAVRERLLARHQTEDFQVRNTASILETASETQNTLTVLLGSVAAISLLVGGIGVMNIMLVSVTERTREIGVRMATGARMRDILLQFNIEAIVVCGVGGALGIVLGLISALLAGSAGVSVAFSPWPAVLAFSCAFATGCLFGYLPARKAAQMDPVQALASE
ncbi:macrolide ABC transporter permease/ATP-binding protein MacB [Aquaspirillum sp. LM1]|uniref:MacB family efflux pump subunit n=1 Tax=Aquaspirillum sp. LM1 TaxID=1938604 RepID=UPI000983C0C2|nr:MacB family efflux pump subunit [Aquaspirillum sp. LM1]AQR64146.1 macrolide ABC transporter permease/ATP-binding protein MacB [Aquaspirillum sp. LM1]